MVDDDEEGGWLQYQYMQRMDGGSRKETKGISFGSLNRGRSLDSRDLSHMTDATATRHQTRSTRGGVLNIASAISFIIPFVISFVVLCFISLFNLHNHTGYVGR